MDVLVYLMGVEQYYVEESCFEKEGSKYFIGEQWVGDVVDCFYIVWLVGFELEVYGYVVDYFKCECQCEYFDLQVIGVYLGGVVVMFEFQFEIE